MSKDAGFTAISDVDAEMTDSDGRKWIIVPQPHRYALYELVGTKRRDTSCNMEGSEVKDWFRAYMVGK